MQPRLTFFAVMSAALVATACHSTTVKISTTCPGKSPCVATAPDVAIKQSSGTYTLTWKSANSSDAWLVNFPDRSPCLAGTLLRSGGEESCVIDVCNMDAKYKYFAISGAGISKDPSVEHDTFQLNRGCPPKPAKPATTSVSPRQGTFFCLDATSGSPASCKNGDLPPDGSAEPLENVLPGDYVGWKLNSDEVITIDEGACKNNTTSIPSSRPNCVMDAAAGNCSTSGSFCTYNYTITGKGAKPGPFHLQVNKPAPMPR